jgi:uncharacterized membrane protein YphA (DoxX/SURF4 family)
MFNYLVGYIQRELQNEQAYLLPLRLFIGLGWLRAGAEKLMGTEWMSGQALTKFLTEQLQTGAVHFPFYEQLIHNVFLPNVVVLSWIIIIGQFMAGMGIMCGAFSNAALLGGMFMNLNFVLVGKTNPSAFYLVIQTVLFVGHTGAVWGLDKKLSRVIPSIFITARPTGNLKPYERQVFLIVACVCWIAAVLFVPSIRDFSPHSVDDPAMLLSILSALMGLTALIIYFQNKTHPVVNKKLAKSKAKQIPLQPTTVLD